ncbi:glycosyltransferase family 4 protein [Streptosporangium sp. NPDC006930]|uniref:glycosyltransferase family 4 protein n=1 Tax=Streptosporangium sp. NPDC006930 TaxID=3154783 RepID=UPI00341F5084
MREMTARLRPVYVVCAEVPPDVVGGLGRYAERMMAAMRHLGTSVEVFGATARHGAPRTERIGDVTLHRVRTLGGGRAGGTSRTPAVVLHVARMIGILVFNVRVTVRILRAGARSSGSVVAVHDWMGCVAGILCRVLARTPVVFHVHTRELNAGSSQRRSVVAAGIAALETVQARLAHLIVVPSVGMRDDLVACGWPPDRLRVIPHGFEDPELLRLAALTGDERDRLRMAVRRRYLPGGEGRLVVFAGRLSPHKGVRTLVRAASPIVGKRDDVRIVLIGAQAPRTDENAEVARLIDDTGVGRHVVAGYRFLGSAEVFAHFLAADVCAFPSTYEPFGLVAIEAMALARPVVVGPGYSPEVVGDGAVRCGHDSPEELADALLRCLDDRRFASRLGERGAAHVRERYMWARTAELTLAAYAELAR